MGLPEIDRTNLGIMGNEKCHLPKHKWYILILHIRVRLGYGRGVILGYVNLTPSNDFRSSETTN